MLKTQSKQVIIQSKNVYKTVKKSSPQGVGKNSKLYGNVVFVQCYQKF